jgi:hypothetical protein
MKEIDRLYHRSMVSTSKKVHGFLLNNDLQDAFKLYCKLKNVTYSEKIEEMMRSAIRSYLDKK